MQEIGEECNEKVFSCHLRTSLMETILTNWVFSMESSNESTLLVMPGLPPRSLSSSQVRYLPCG